MELELLLMTVAILLHAAISVPVAGLMTASNIFLFMQFVMAAGTYGYLDPARSADRFHWAVILYTFFAFWATSLFLILVDSRKTDRFGRSGVADRQLGPRPKIVFVRPDGVIFFWLIVSIGVCLAYYTAVGYNILLQGLFAGGVEDVASARLATYAGEQYFFPGYVNQFKNALLPALVMVVGAYLIASKRPGRWVILLSLIAVTVVFLMGTGQRGALVTAMLVALVFGSHLGRKVLRRFFLIIGTLGIGLFSIGSVVLGRSSAEYERAAGFVDKFGVILQELLARIVDSNQLASAAAFRYIHSIPVENGMEMFRSITGLLPGVSGSDLSNVVFSHLYGSDRGTAPPSIWGVVYHNFGEVGVILAPMVLAVAYYAVSMKIRRTCRVNTVQAVGMAGTTTLLGMWVAGGPEYLANSGVVVYTVLWILGSRMQNRRSQELDNDGAILRTPKSLTGDCVRVGRPALLEHRTRHR